MLVRRNKQLAKTLKGSSACFAIAGGFLLALNLAFSRYGFAILAASSLQLLLASYLERDRALLFYSLGLFLFNDCLGVYRWLL